MPRDYGEEPEGVAERETKAEMEVSSPQFLAGFKCPPAGSGEDWFRQELLGGLAYDILLGDSAPLYLRLYNEGLINSTFGGDYELLPGFACFYAGGDSRDSRAVVDAVLKEAARLASGGIDPDFYQRTRRAAYGAYLRGFNSFENIAVSLTDGYFHGFDPFRYPEVFESIRLEDVAAFLGENIVEDRMVLSEIVPRA